MKHSELVNRPAPFWVARKFKNGKLHKTQAKVVGFKDSDPLGVGFQVVIFENGMWITAADLLRYYFIVEE